MVYRDAGEDGEQILRRAVEGVPAMLRPGGRFYSMQMASDRVDESLEQRVRKWLGESHEEFDIVLAVVTAMSPAEQVSKQIAGKLKSIGEVGEFLEMYARLQVKSLVYGGLLIERHDSPRQPLTGRVHAGTGFLERHLDWVLRWQQMLIKPETAAMTPGWRPVAAPDCKLRSAGSLHEHRFVMNEFQVASQCPFQSTLRCDEWLTDVIRKCDGTLTYAEHYDLARASGLMTQSLPFEKFAGALNVLVTLGLLRLVDFPLPAPAGPEGE
jgi:hypothetical protein